MTGAILRRELLAPARKLRTFGMRGGYGLVLAAVFGVFYLVYEIDLAMSGLLAPFSSPCPNWPSSLPPRS